MDPRIELAALTGRVGWQIARERVIRPRPTTLREVPPGPASLTDEWLTLALCDAVPGARVIGHTLGARDAGTSSRERLTVTYNAAGSSAGLPTQLFTKSAPNFQTRLQSKAAALGEIEANFYAHVRPELEIEAPPTLYSAYDPASGRQMLITEDLAAGRGAQFADVLTRTIDFTQAERMLDTLSALHIAYWGAPLHRRFGGWLWTSYEYQARLNVTIGAEARILAGFERGRGVIPARLYDRRHEFYDAMMSALSINVTGPQTLLHSDLHPGNWYLTTSGAMGLCDWQCVVRGGWARDLAYALASNLTPEQRRDWERPLVDAYVERLVAAGITAPVDPFLEYRQQLPHAVFFWLATLGRHPLHQELQTNDIAVELVRRLTIATDELETLDAIRTRPGVPAIA